MKNFSNLRNRNMASFSGGVLPAKLVGGILSIALQEVMVEISKTLEERRIYWTERLFGN